jgi:NAD(P)-dependent dehydrogenase (short-subunit alcohol dehydrogenase family)
MYDPGMASICVVTGAGRGLGRLIAERFAGKGFAVLCTDIDGAAAEETARTLGGGAWAMAQDVRDPASHRAVAAAAAARGTVAVWVNNAGVLHVGPAWELGEAEIRRLVEVNVLGVIWGAQAAVGVMRERGGVLINIASISSLVPAPGLAVYGATKHAVLGFTTSLQGDLDRAGLPIRCAAVCPDAMETDMVKDVAHDDASSILFSAKKMLRAEDVADEVADLAAHPRLVTVLPRARAALVHAFRAFPALELRVLAMMSKAGRKAREKRGLT